MSFRSYKLEYGLQENTISGILLQYFMFNSMQYLSFLSNIWVKHQMFYLYYNCVVAGSSVDGFSAIKMTALGRPQFLVTLSLTLAQVSVK